VVNLGAAPVEVTRGMRIAQLIIAKVESPAMVEVGELPETPRGDGGFGSTGT
jgi:dUTP pyrophosphatase